VSVPLEFVIVSEERLSELEAVLLPASVDEVSVCVDRLVDEITPVVVTEP
jgi:hypothetical protein